MKLFLFLAGSLAVLFCQPACGQSMGPMSGSQPKSFSLKGDNLGVFQNSVNLFTGQLNFALPVSEIRGNGNLAYSLAFSYSSQNIRQQATTWNIEAPTSVLGLGWNIDLPRIVVDHKGTAARQDDDFYVVEGGTSYELRFNELQGSDWVFETKNYQYWKISYAPAQEKWTITKEDGTRYVYGDNSSNRLTVQYMVKWRNWIGNSNLIAGQQAHAYVWNLSEIVDLWGDRLLFTYLHDSEYVAGGNVLHTKACYLKEVTNSMGEKLVLSYSNKTYDATNKEYQDPHTEQAEGDAYQEKFESKFLSSISRLGSAANVLQLIDLSYSFLGTGLGYKRCLSAITTLAPSGAQASKYQFQYENSEPFSNYGALKRVVIPTGGTIDYFFNEVILSNTSRQFTVPAVANYSEAQFWINEDFIVISRRRLSAGVHSDSFQSVILDVLTWENGRWYQQNLGDQYSTNGTLYSVKLINVGAQGTTSWIQDFQFVMGKDFFATLNKQGNTSIYALNLFKRNRNLPGSWYHQRQEFTPLDPIYSYPGENPTLLAGDDFVMVGSRENKHWVATTSEFNSSWTISQFVKASGRYFYAAANNYVLVHKDNNEKATDEITLYVRGQNEVWQQYAFPGNQGISTYGVSRWHSSNSFAMIFAAEENEFFFTWDENYGSVTRHNSGIRINDNSFVDIVNNTLVSASHNTEGYGFRYNGNAFVASGQFPSSYAGYGRLMYSFGEDVIFNRRNPSAQVNRLSFNPNSGSWQPIVVYTPLTTMSGSLEGSVMADHRFAIIGGRYLYREPNGAFTQFSEVSPSCFDLIPFPESCTFPPVAQGIPDVIISGGQILTIRRSGNAPQSVHFSGLQESTSEATQWFKHSSPHAAGFSMISHTAFLQENATNFTVYRMVRESVTGPISSWVVNRSLINNSTYQMYEYDLATATTDGSGMTPQFLKVTSFANSTGNNARPAGYTESYFLNGTLGDFSSEDWFSSSVGPNYKRFLGMPYKLKVFNKDNAWISETRHDYQILTRGYGQFIRPLSVNVWQDGINVKKTFQFAVFNGQLRSESVMSRPNGNPLEVTDLVSNETYYWSEYYDPSNTRNILTLPAFTRKLTSGSTQTEATAITYKNWGANSVPVPHRTYMWRKTTPTWFNWWNETQTPPSADWALMQTLTSVDGRGFPTTQNDRSGVAQSKLWMATEPLLLADIENGSPGSCYYDNFERATANVSSDAVGGKQSSTASLVVSLPGPGFYTLTYWSKSGSNPWQLNQQSLNFDSQNAANNNVTIGGSGLLIDEVRLHPVSARMTTYSYDRLGNLLSVCSPNNIFSHTEYDEFNRPRLIRDEHKNITTFNFYNIKP